VARPPTALATQYVGAQTRPGRRLLQVRAAAWLKPAALLPAVTGTTCRRSWPASTTNAGPVHPAYCPPPWLSATSFKENQQPGFWPMMVSDPIPVTLVTRDRAQPSCG